MASRDALVARCWEAQAICEAATNRVIGRLRGLAQADDGARCQIHTIARVGHTVLEHRRTRPLFRPPTKAMRREPRFAVLVDDLELTRYWWQAGIRPDYQTGRDG